jgi:hypothetical protein
MGRMGPGFRADLEAELLPYPGARFMPQILHTSCQRRCGSCFHASTSVPSDRSSDEGGWALLLMFPLLVLGRLHRQGAAGHCDLRERCRRFESGEWQALLSEFRAASETASTQAEQAGDGAMSDEDDEPVV